MENQELFEQVDFKVNPQYEKIIEELLRQQYSITDTFFEASEIEILRTATLGKLEEDQFKKAAIGNRTNEVIAKTIRGDFILWMDEQKADAAEKVFFSKINPLVNYLNATCFMGILHKEFHYAVYPTGTFYKRHLDAFQNDSRRKLSMVCYLNEENWLKTNGGELVIYKPDGTEEIIYPLPGRVVIFESQLLEHEVKVVKNDQRLSITGWLKTR
ncbi:2OG-Fe(II) oxygenase [Mesonia sp. MT50]|uniref:2OG-Fe(II) oxygenase n=1 Tax=Mesonia profundi TaxID=3070998 RepID=A0ABU0ZYY2_9FLAO|nr:2OG-Fe(II) oxygenase [Mesonia profundi]MDQ7916667.1 2OG-Fe(II) oxygenase [Mesonia profundi]